MPNVSRNSIEYNLTNKLFKNCKRRFIIDINDNEDVQITSCFENKNDKHVLVNLDDYFSSPKELKLKLNKGTKGKLQFRTYSLKREDENLKEAISDLLSDNMSTAQLDRKVNYLNNRSYNYNHTANHSQRRTRSRSAENQIQTRSRSKDRSGRASKSNSFGSIGKSKKEVANKVAKKRSRSIDHEAEEERSIKRKKVTYKKVNIAKKSSNSKDSKNSKPKNQTKKAKPKPKKKESASNQTASASNTQPFEVIDLIESSVESENANGADSSIVVDSQDLTDSIVHTNDNTNDYHSQQSPTQSMTTIEAEDIISRYLNQSDSNQNDSNHSLDQSSSVNTSPTPTTSNAAQQSNTQETDDLIRKYLNYQELENHVNKLKEQNAAEIKNRRSSLVKKTIVSSNKNKDQVKKSSIYHLDDNLISVDDKLGIKHLITCLTIIAIGELVHYLQPKASLNYYNNQLPVGCLLISNLINSVQFTMVGILLSVLINLLVPKLFSIIRTSSRLICYCLLLFLSYGLLRKSITNWILNNNRSTRLFPLNVSICCSMLISYSAIALYLSTDGNRIVKARKSSHRTDELDNESNRSESSDTVQTKKSNWFDVIVNILTPYLLISPIIGTNTVRLYNVPKPLLGISALIYLFGLYKYCVGRLERNPSLKNQKRMVYELKEDSYLFSSTSRVRYLTLFGALLMITAYNLLVLNLWSLLLELFVLAYLKLRSYYLDKHFTKLNKTVYSKYRTQNPYAFSSWIH